jgi:hypothetical protein
MRRHYAVGSRYGGSLMFALLGKAVTRFWPLLLGAWLVLLGAGRYFAPAWDEVTQAGDAFFLPEDSPSRGDSG